MQNDNNCNRCMEPKQLQNNQIPFSSAQVQLMHVTELAPDCQIGAVISLSRSVSQTYTLNNNIL